MIIRDHLELFWAMFDMASVFGLFPILVKFLAGMGQNTTWYDYQGLFERCSMWLQFWPFSNFGPIFGWNGPKYDLIWSFWALFALASVLVIFHFWSKKMWFDFMSYFGGRFFTVWGLLPWGIHLCSNAARPSALITLWFIHSWSVCIVYWHSFACL